jgi:hypothetical protein
MAQIDARSVIEAAAAAGHSATATRTAPHRLAEAAAQVASEPVVTALSPIVLAGAVRMIELALVALIGTLIYSATWCRRTACNGSISAPSPASRYW